MPIIAGIAPWYFKKAIQTTRPASDVAEMEPYANRFSSSSV